jgi:tRNA(Ile)-lysidine synthase
VLEQFLNHIRQNQLCSATDKILLAVSGGVDSMVMLDLFHHTGFDVSVAHCNFQLRPEAVREQDMVSHLCASKGIPFFVKQFDTLQYANEKGISTQVAARELRYGFFRWLSDAHGYRCIATAHHANDDLETVLLNLVRGTGIDGVTGIPRTNGDLIRPMLFATRAEIITYAMTHQVPWLEDSSNAGNHYSRNLLRNEVVPILKKINPGLERTFLQTLERLRGSRSFSDQWLALQYSKNVSSVGEELHIRRDGLQMQHAIVMLWEWVKEFGFRYDQCISILQDHSPGKRFNSSTHQLVVDREVLIIVPRSEPVHEWHTVQTVDEVVVTQHGQLRFSLLPVSGFKKDCPATIAQLDFHHLKFPLIIRKWEAGDSFVPLGMTHHKKLSDFLIDSKISVLEKGKILVVESGGEIVWVVGHRISDLVKITPTTTEIFLMDFDVANRVSGDKTQH